MRARSRVEMPWARGWASRFPTTTGSSTPSARSRAATSSVFCRRVEPELGLVDPAVPVGVEGGARPPGAWAPPSSQARATVSKGTSAPSARETHRYRLTRFTGATRRTPSDSTRSTRSGRSGRMVAVLRVSPARRSTFRYRTEGPPAAVTTVASTISAAGPIEAGGVAHGAGEHLHVPLPVGKEGVRLHGVVAGPAVLLGEPVIGPDQELGLGLAARVGREVAQRPLLSVRPGGAVPGVVAGDAVHQLRGVDVPGRGEGLLALQVQEGVAHPLRGDDGALPPREGPGPPRRRRRPRRRPGAAPAPRRPAPARGTPRSSRRAASRSGSTPA